MFKEEHEEDEYKRMKKEDREELSHFLSELSSQFLYMNCEDMSTKQIDELWKDVYCNEKQSYAKIPHVYIRKGKLLFNDSAKALFDKDELTVVKCVLLAHWEHKKQSTIVMLTDSLSTISELGARDVKISELEFGAE